MSSLEQRLKARARDLGFDLVGITDTSSPETFSQFEHWLSAGHAGEMGYLERHAAARRHPKSILVGVRSVVMVGMNYKPAEHSPLSPCGRGVGGEGDAFGLPLADRGEDSLPPQPSPTRGEGERRSPLPLTGKVARYARGLDYHDVLRARLNQLLAWVQEEVPDCHGRGVVDTAPLLERDFARRAGLGWFGKNTMLLNRNLGSYFFLGALLLDVLLQPDPTFATNHCGSCTACLDACPTQAFPAPHQLDARRCLSYLTIELKGPIPEELRAEMGDWFFGCDICQEVCPWNRKAPTTTEPAFQPRPGLDLVELLELDATRLKAKVRGTALTRPKRRGLLRNAAIVLGNLGEVRALPALEKAAQDPDPVVAEAARWALRRIAQKQANT